MPALPCVSVAFVANSPNNVLIVAVIAKRTYELDSAGNVSIAEDQLKFLMPEEDDEGAPFPNLISDCDLYPVKLSTDVVVMGKVHAPKGVPTRRMRASVKVGSHEKVIEVFGDRTVAPYGDTISFTDPALFTSMDLTYARAYGGIDRSVPLPQVTQIEDLLDLIGRELTKRHPGMYPRNPSGTGYAVTGVAASLEGLRLPNFEDPARLLTPDSLVVGKPQDWWKMPLPQGFGWFASGNYPRSLFLGGVPEFPPPDDLDVVEEVRMGLVSRGQSARVAGLELHEVMDFRITNGAAPGLIVPDLVGDERVTLTGLSAAGDIEFTLPGDRPRVEVTYKARPLKVTVRLHTVLIEPERRRFSLVWGAYAPTPNGFPERIQTPEHPAWDELDGFEIRLDGDIVPHEPVNPFGPVATSA